MVPFINNKYYAVLGFFCQRALPRESPPVPPVSFSVDTWSVSFEAGFAWMMREACRCLQCSTMQELFSQTKKKSFQFFEKYMKK